MGEFHLAAHLCGPPIVLEGIAGFLYTVLLGHKIISKEF